MKILANDGISASGKKMLQDAGYEFLDHKVSQEHLANFINENNVEILLVRSATKVKEDIIDACKNLKIVGRGGVGMDNIAVDYAKSKGISVINTPISSSRSVAEMVFAHFFSLARNLHESNRMMPLEGETKFNDLKKSYANAVELEGKTLGIIGFGNIGKEVAKIGIALGMKIEILNLHAREEKISLNFFDGQTLEFTLNSTDNKEEFLPKCDFISINTPKSDGYILDSAEFELMKDGVFICNTARGGVLNEVALIDFIEDGKIAGAALDVFENEPTPEMAILMNPAVSLTPHLAGSTVDAQEKIGQELAQQIININQNF